MHTKQIKYNVNVRCDVCPHMLLGISVLGVIIIIIIHNYCCNKINILVTTSSLLHPLAIPTSYIFIFPWTFYLYRSICKILKLSNVIIRQLQLPQHLIPWYQLLVWSGKFRSVSAFTHNMHHTAQIFKKGQMPGSAMQKPKTGLLALVSSRWQWLALVSSS